MNDFQKDAANQSQSQKQTQNKTRWDLMSPIALEEIARVYTMGAAKYSPRGWERGIPFMELFGALMRHAWAWRNGADIDDESGLHHMAHAAWNAMAILHLSFTRPTYDDREDKC